MDFLSERSLTESLSTRKSVYIKKNPYHRKTDEFVATLRIQSRYIYVYQYYTVLYTTYVNKQPIFLNIIINISNYSK